MRKFLKTINFFLNIDYTFPSDMENEEKKKTKYIDTREIFELKSYNIQWSIQQRHRSVFMDSIKKIHLIKFFHKYTPTTISYQSLFINVFSLR